jgi:hypothetical protein
MKHQHEHCECLFCSCKCPECGSRRIEINYKPKFELRNVKESSINILCPDVETQLSCKECGAHIESGGFREHDHRLHGIEQAMWNYLELKGAATFEVDE